MTDPARPTVAPLFIEQRIVDSLTLDPANVRRHGPENLLAIRASLRKFGQQKPIVVTPDGIVIAGNGTLEAARAEGWDSISVVVTDLHDVDRAAFAIADNRTSELAEWDHSALCKMIDVLEAEYVDPADMGWSKQMLVSIRRATDGAQHEQGAPLPGLAGVDADEADRIDPDAYDFDHACPRCGFEYDTPKHESEGE